MNAHQDIAGRAASSAILEAALSYALKRGWPVIPCKPGDKAPYISGGFHAVTCDETQIREWWSKWPSAMIGVPTGHVIGDFALDPDAPEAPDEPDGEAALRELEAQHGTLPATRAHNTPGGGRHLLFSMPEGMEIGCSSGRLPDGIHVWGNGGYIVMPPSVRQDGRKYEVAGQVETIAPAPDWLLDLITGCKAREDVEARRVTTGRAKADSRACTASPDDIAEVREALQALPNDYDREGWVRFGMAAYEGGLDFEDFDNWSRLHPTYNPKHTRKTWDSFKKGVRDITKATLFREVRERVLGWKPSRKRSRVMKKVSPGDARVTVAKPPDADSKPCGDVRALNVHALQRLDEWLPGLGDQVERQSDGSYVVTADVDGVVLAEPVTISPTDGDTIGAYAGVFGMLRDDAAGMLADRLGFELEVHNNAALSAARAEQEKVERPIKGEKTGLPTIYCHANVLHDGGGAVRAGHLAKRS